MPSWHGPTRRTAGHGRAARERSARTSFVLRVTAVALAAFLGSQATAEVVLRCVAFLAPSRLTAASCTRRPPETRLCRRIARQAAEATKEERKVLKLTGEYPLDPDGDDVAEVVDALKKLPKASEASYDAYALLLGDWKVEWSSLGGRGFSKASKPASLKMLSFSALPATDITILGSYNRVVGDSQGGSYQLVQTFTVPDSNGAEAAMVLEGNWGKGGAEGAWGKGALRVRVPVQFKTVRLVPSASNPEESRAMLEAAGLGGYMEPTDVKAQATYVDLDHMSDIMRVHKGESGAVYVLSRLSEPIPFLLD
eukprot:TRINITY_DN38531_c0_g1_i1.p1 TRINITY_DN38531_c0_g1~~TRINITY_DN38531_c0_g1_i1.p1  ORF type:complete len:323 (+),score=59.23 TRINITY_DN38531_c0_g1_i1:41-970(+)